ncbi:MAG: hypothetical protein KY455_03405 [Euryarchaeota archaeon]|nr:hypothetical protein [Euryarchaeota archaeon]
MRLPLVLLLVLTLIAVAGPALAHTAGDATVETRVVMPAWVAWGAGALVVALSFALVGVFVGREPRFGHGAPLPAVDGVFGRAGGVPVGQVVGFAFLAATIAGLVFPAAPLPNVLVWLVVWAGLATAAYTMGDVWPRIDPFRLIGRATAAFRGGPAPFRYPAWLGSWPAVLLFLGIVGLEVTGPLGHSGGTLAWSVGMYTLLVLAGMLLFGEERWLAEAEVLGRTFRWWAAASPFRREDGRLRVGVAGARLDALPVIGVSDVAFTLAVLYGVNHDAFSNGPPGAAARGMMAGHVVEPWSSLVLLAGGYLLFLVVFFLCAAWMRRMSGTLLPTGTVAARFVAALVPIAVGYHLAHNLPRYLTEAPLLLAALSDPFAQGWDVLGTAHWTTLALSSDTWGWLGYFAVFAILVGHVLAVVAAHRLAVRLFPSRVQALKAEVPLTVVMVFYTLVGLWLVSAGGSA